MKRIERVLLVLSLVAAAIAPAVPALAAIDPAGGFGEGPIAGTLTVKVIDELTGAPLADAFCLFGTAPGVPIPGNALRTNGAGIASFADASLTGPQTVTVGKEGYSCCTVFGIDARQMTLPIRLKGSQAVRPTYEGDISGFNVTWNDGLVDLALVWRTFYARELVSFASDLLGGSLERFAPTIGADFLGLGLQPIPGAIYLPFQIELILYPFSRTPYIIYVEDQTTTDISAVYSRIPVQTIIDELGSPKPDFLALIRALDVRKYAIEEGIEVDGPGEQDLTLDIAEGAPVLVRVANTIPGLNVFSVALADLDGLSGGGRLMPCGFGGAAGGTDTLLALSTLGSGAPGSPDYLAGALQSDTVDGTANTGVFVRTGLTAGDTADATQYLAVPVAALQSDVFTWTPTANAPAGLFPDVQRAGITLVTTIPDTNAWAEPGDTLDIPIPLWNFYLGGADTSFVLPCLGPDFPSPLVDPTTTPDQDRLDWGITAIRLGLDPSFDYDDWDLVDLGLSGTHIAGEQERFVPLPGTPYTAVAAAPAPGAGRLGAPSPNPFRVETRVRFAVPAREESARLAVYDIAGRRVRSLASGGAGREATWDGRDESGRVVPSGIYLFRLEAGGEVLTRKVVKTR